MIDIDYQKLGLKCGVEIHQQLDTKKLFCSCPCEIREDAPDVVIRRRLRAVAGEMGGIDPAALHEFLRSREFVYEGYTSSNCLVELDEEPPHPLNHEALSVALEVSLLLNSKPVDELQVMRKTVIDGSNTSGFQRTVLVAMDGFVDAPEGRVGILTVCLEEDAARKIKEEGSVTTYRLDRLGIPLVEIATAPDIKSPQHARVVAEKLGMILRATNKVKRGLGTIRQDLNVSIREGARVEVKGVQDLRLISKIVECEVQRQLMLIDVKNELHMRKVSEDGLFVDYADLSVLFKKSTSKVIRSALDNGGVVLAVEMRGFADLLKGRLGPELAQYARAIAGVKGIFHSDELPGYGITVEEVLEVCINLDIKDGEAFVLVAEKEAVAHAALNAVLERARQALKGVPKETRKATPEGTSEFMRPLPGSARMYPETDEPLVVIDDKYLKQVRGSLSALPEEKLEEFVAMGLSKELAGQLVKSRWVLRFEEFVKRFPEVKPSVTATMLISMPKEVRKRFDVDIESLGEEKYAEILSFLNEKKILRDAVPDILAELGKDPNSSVKDIIHKKGFSFLTESELGMIIDKVIKENPSKPQGMIIGRVMAEVRGRADAEAVKKAVEEKLRI